MDYKKLIKGEVIILPKYGVFSENSEDKKQIKEMEEGGFILEEETSFDRIWVRRTKKECKR